MFIYIGGGKGIGSGSNPGDCTFKIIKRDTASSEGEETGPGSRKEPAAQSKQAADRDEGTRRKQPAALVRESVGDQRSMEASSCEDGETDVAPER
ncbi:UNVERIFIED_CONTAM: hypothetical protein FKN15_021645 [Acipenser sinensis]